MYGLPADFDPRPFVARELTQIWFQKYTLQFIFGESEGEMIYVTLESAFTYQANADAAVIRQEPPAKASLVTELIGRRVAGAQASVDGTLTLVFEGGAVLQFLDESPQYEAYQIYFQGGVIVVV